MGSEEYKREVIQLLPGLPPYQLVWEIDRDYARPRTFVWANMIDPEFKFFIGNNYMETVWASGHDCTEEQLKEQLRTYLRLRIKEYGIRVDGYSHQLSLFK